MFHKRLMKEFKENQKYVAGMVAAQWGSLLCNVALMYASAFFWKNCFWGTKTLEREISRSCLLSLRQFISDVQCLQASEAGCLLLPRRR